MSAEQFAFVVGVACGAGIGALITWRVLVRAFARIVGSKPELRKAWLKDHKPDA